MLADSLLPIPFWAEAVNTACYVLNRVLVSKPQNKTPYELLIGKSPSISFMRPFGCSLTILNTLDSLGKFDGKSDEGYLLGYSTSSKAFRVYNKRTKRVEENLHINFLEDQPNVVNMDADKHLKKKRGKLHLKKKAAQATNTNTLSTDRPFVSTDRPFVSTDRAYDDDEDVGCKWLISTTWITPILHPIPTSEFPREILTSAVQTRGKIQKASSAQQALTISQALQDESWVKAMQEELLQFKLQKVWVLVDFPYGKKGLEQEEGIDYDEVFAPVARIEAIRSMIGSLTYLTASRLYIMFAVPSTSNPISYGKLRDSPFELEAYSDSDYGGANLDRKSTIVKQFWQTVTVRTLANGTQQLVASIDSKEYTITEASVRSKLQLADATGIHNLSDAKIYAGLATLRYVTEGDIIPLLPAMLAGVALDQGEGSAQPAEPHPTPVDPLPSISSPLQSPPHSPLQSPPHSPPHSPLQSLPYSPLQSPPHSPFQSPPHSPLQLPPYLQPHSPHQSPPFSPPHFSPPRSYEAPLPEGNTSGSAEDSMQLKELMDIIPKLVTRIETLETELQQTKTTYGKAVITLVKRVKILEKSLKERHRR
ncbi:retrovirus-related pol polyprotein from transposon TNT 1-94, partial [Tanacetum coccineum]